MSCSCIPYVAVVHLLINACSTVFPEAPDIYVCLTQSTSHLRALHKSQCSNHSEMWSWSHLMSDIYILDLSNPNNILSGIFRKELNGEDIFQWWIIIADDREQYVWCDSSDRWILFCKKIHVASMATLSIRHRELWPRSDYLVIRLLIVSLQACQTSCFLGIIIESCLGIIVESEKFTTVRCDKRLGGFALQKQS